MVWTCELLDRVRWLWDQGLTATEISERVDKSRNAILGKLDRLRKQGAKVQSRTTSPTAASPRRMHPAKKFRLPSGTRRERKGRGKRMLMPPSSDAASPPPPILEPIVMFNGWEGMVAEISHLKKNHCRFPLGDPVTGFCRAPTGNHESYCDYHHRICCVPLK